jgi:ATP-dependent Clp protease ATP-binding subunit ClpC
MAMHRLPLFIWQDFEGFWTAAPLEPWLVGEDAAAVDTTAQRAAKQMQSYVEWWFEQHPWSSSPDFLDPELITAKISIRPQYRDSDRVYPCDEEFELKVPCVHGRQENGLLVCSMPTLGTAFHFYERGELRRMIAETVRHRLGSLTPQQLSRFLPPKEVCLEEISVRVREQSRSHFDANELPALSRSAQAIGEPAFRKRFTAAWQREQEIADLVDKLGRYHANVALVGEPSSGKSTVLVNAVRALERNRSDDETPAATVRRRYWLTNAARLIAGMKYLGEWQQRFERIIGDLSSIDGILCVENLLELLLVGGTGPAASVGAFLLPYLQNGQLRMVVETTSEEFEACRRLLPGLADVFQVLRIEPMSPAKARAALAAVAASRTRDMRIAAETQISDNVVHLFCRFMPYNALPGRATRFLTGLFDKGKKREKSELTLADVFEAFIEQTGLPEQMLRDDLPLEFDEIEKEFTKSIIGQTAACRMAAEVIATFKAGMNDPRRPLATLLFCGPTGVGKTELAKTMSTYLFGHGKKSDRLIRLDMSEFASPWNVERLVSKDDGTPSEFLQKVRQQPFVVVLLDEIEKASAEVFDMLLGVLDEGRLTDRFGRTTIFRSAIVIMTSNLGGAKGKSIGFEAGAEGLYEKAVQDFFRPEFFNRIDAVVSFRPLNEEVCRAIVRKEVADLSRRDGLAQVGLRLVAGDAMIEHLLRTGFDWRYGARPLQRVLETHVVTPLSRYLLNQPELRDAEVHIDIDADGNAVFK